MEIQFNYFGNSSSLLIECYDIEFVDEDHNSQSDFRSHFSDDSRQNTSTTHAYMLSILKELKKGNKVNRNYPIWENTDGFYKKY